MRNFTLFAPNPEREPEKSASEMTYADLKASLAGDDGTAIEADVFASNHEEARAQFEAQGFNTDGATIVAN